MRGAAVQVGEDAEAEAAVPERMIGLASTGSGRNGSGARIRRSEKTNERSAEAAISPTMTSEPQA